MRYFAKLDGKERVVDLESLGGSQFKIRIDEGSPRVIEAERLDGEVMHLLIDGASHEIDVEADGDAVSMIVEDELIHLDLVDERQRRLQSSKGGGAMEGKVVLKAPMPGKVVKLLVEPGQEVTEQQGLVVIEAMKMENELRSPRAGKVTQVFVKEGQTVEGKAELLSVE